MLSSNHSIGVGAPRRQVQDFSETRYWLCNSFQIQVMQAQQSLFHKLTTVTNFLAAKIIFTTTLRNTLHARTLGVVFARQCGPSINVLIPINIPASFLHNAESPKGKTYTFKGTPSWSSAFTNRSVTPIVWCVTYFKQRNDIPATRCKTIIW